MLNLSNPMSFLIQAETRSALAEIGAGSIGQAFQMRLVLNDDEIESINSTAANLALPNSALPRTFRGQGGAERPHGAHQAARDGRSRIEDRIARRGASHYPVKGASEAAECRSSLSYKCQHTGARIVGNLADRGAGGAMPDRKQRRHSAGQAVPLLLCLDNGLNRDVGPAKPGRCPS